MLLILIEIVTAYPEEIKWYYLLYEKVSMVLALSGNPLLLVVVLLDLA